MTIQYATYNDENMEVGKFYILEINKDLASNIREATSFTQPIVQNTQSIQQLQRDIQAIDRNEDAIIDNTRRINNLEDRSLQQELFYALDQASIKVTFVNKTHIEIEHNRKEIYFKKVMTYTGTVGNTENYEDSTSSVKISEQLTRDTEGKIINKKVLIDSNFLITGYAIIL